MSDTVFDMNTAEQAARINQLVADALLKNVQTKTTVAQVAFAGFTAGAAVIGAAVALMKVLGV